MRKILTFIFLFLNCHFLFSQDLNFSFVKNEHLKKLDNFRNEYKSCTGRYYSNGSINWIWNNGWIYTPEIISKISKLEIEINKETNLTWGSKELNDQIEKRFLAENKDLVDKYGLYFRNDRGIVGFLYELDQGFIKVTDVQIDSPANKSGLMVNDLIISVGGNKLPIFPEIKKGINDLDVNIVKNYLDFPIGKKQIISVRRGKNNFDLEIVANELEFSKKPYVWHDCYGKNGFYEGLYIANELVFGLYEDENFLRLGPYIDSYSPNLKSDEPTIFEKKKEKILYVGKIKNSHWHERGIVYFPDGSFSDTVYDEGIPKSKAKLVLNNQKNLNSPKYEKEFLFLKKLYASDVINYQKEYRKFHDKWTSIIKKHPEYKPLEPIDFILSDNQFISDKKDIEAIKIKVIDYINKYKNKKLSDIEYSVTELFDFYANNWAQTFYFNFTGYTLNNQQYEAQIKQLDYFISSYPKDHPYYSFALLMSEFLTFTFADKRFEYLKLKLENFDSFYASLKEILPNEIMEGAHYCEEQFLNYMDLLSIGVNARYSPNSIYANYYQKILDDILQNNIQCGTKEWQRYYYIERGYYEYIVKKNAFGALYFYDAAAKIHPLSNSEKYDLASAHYVAGQFDKAKEILGEVLETCKTDLCENLRDYETSPILEENDYLSTHEDIDKIISFSIVKSIYINGLSNTFDLKEQNEKNIYHPISILLKKIATYEAYKEFKYFSETEPEQTNMFWDQKQAYFRELISKLIKVNRYPEADEIQKIIKKQDIYAYTVRADDYLMSDYIPPLNKIENELFQKYMQLSSTKKYVEFRKLDKDEIEKQKKEFNKFLSLVEKTFSEENIVLRGEGEHKNVNNQVTTSKYTAESSILKLEATQKNLKSTNPNASIIRFNLSDSKIETIVTTYSDQRVFSTPINKAELFKDIFSLRFAIINEKNDQFFSMSNKLHAILFQPIESYLVTNNIDHVYLSLDQNLRYVPFSSLWDKKQFLVEKFHISVYPDVTDQDFFSKPKENDFFIGFASSKQYDSFSALPNARNEVQSILNVMQKKDKSKLYLDDDFTKRNFFNELTNEYPIVHISTHFKLNSTKYEESFFLMGDGTRLSINEFVNEKSIDQSREVFSLSACETAKIGEKSNGAEIDSLVDIVLKKGSKSVLATLWQIPDKSTSIFMSEFYKNLSKGQSKIEALTNAQRQFIHSTNYINPLFWSSFIISGNPF